MQIKSAFRNTLNRVGFDIIRSAPGYKAVRIPQIGSTISPLKLIFRSLFQVEKMDFFFIQIGANDGLRSDPIHELIIRHQLHGLLVEPLPEFFSQLKKNYQTQSHLRFENAAISDHNGTGLLWRFHPDAPIPDKCHGMARFNEKSIRKVACQYNIQNYIITTRVKLITFEKLLEKYDIGAYDFLQIDTEGYEYKILQMVMKTRFKPKLIHYEFQNLSFQERLDSCSLLSQNGYKFIHDTFDTIAIHYSTD